MALLQSVAELMIPVMTLAVIWSTWRRHEMKRALANSLNGWEKQLAQTEVLCLIEDAHAQYLVEQDLDQKAETARRRIRDRVDADSGKRPNSELTSTSGLKRQRERIQNTREKLNVSQPA